MSDKREDSRLKNDSMDDQLKEKLYQKMKAITLELSGIGRVLGYEKLTAEFQKTISELKQKEETN